MPREILQPLIGALATTIGAPITTLLEAPPTVRRAALQFVDGADDDVVAFETDGGRFLARRYHRHRTAVLVLGPYRRPDDPPGEFATLDAVMEERARTALGPAAAGFGQAVSDRAERLELSSQLELINSAAIAITGELTLETVLRRIVDLAREVVGARYAALGVAGPGGILSSFLTSGMNPEEEAAIPEPPHGKGVIGLLVQERRTIRLPDLREHPASVGFPPGHPSMTSFLGVPIFSHGRVLGNLYLTDKRFAREFTDEDARLVELLARYAAVAIENAELYRHAEQQQVRLQAIIDQLPEAVIILEANPDRVTLANTQASGLLGWEVQPPMSLEEFIGRNPRYGLDNEPMPRMAVPMVRALHEGNVGRSEVRVLRPDGRMIAILVNTAPLRDDHGDISAAIAVFQDITQIKDAEQLKDDFLSLISHELRTPLTTIQGGAMLLLQDGNQIDADTRQLLLGDMAGESRRLADLVENMVQLANIRAGRLGMDTEPIHVGAVIERAVKAMRELAPDRPFAVNVDRDLLAIGDAGRIDQVVRNLLQNAVKYAPPGCPIEVNASREDGMVVVAVRDHGPGIADEDLPFVFDRFRRGSRAAHTSTAGMGLGLYLSKHLVEAQGGRIWIERPNDGGTRVLFSLPRIPPDA